MTQISINGVAYELHKNAKSFNTAVQDKSGTHSPITYTREEILEGIAKNKKDIVSFVAAQIEKGSPYFKEVSATEEDLENIKILEEATTKVETLESALAVAEKEIAALKAELAKAKEGQ